MVARHASSVAFSQSILQVIDANTRDSCTRKCVALINMLFYVLSLPSARSLELCEYGVRLALHYHSHSFCMVPNTVGGTTNLNAAN
jgi:hypothetical protein